MNDIFELPGQAIADVFAEDIEIKWLDKPDRELNGVYDSRFWQTDTEGEVGVSTLITSLSVIDDENEGPKVDEQLVARGNIYRIKDKRPDAEGWAVLELEFVSADA